MDGRVANDRGSIMLAMLAILVVGSVAAVVAATVLAGRSNTRVNAGFEQALHGAETGLDRMAVQVRQDPFASSHPPISGVDDATSVRYQATATPHLDAEGAPTGDWTLTSVGTDDKGATRTVQATVSAPGVFNVAAFGRFFADFNGGNGADSFDSDDGPAARYVCSPVGPYPSTDYRDMVDDADVRMCNPTHSGIVATNGRLKLKGQAADNTDRAEVHFARERVDDPLPGATGFCDGVPDLCDRWNPAASPDYPAGTTPPGGLYYYRDPVRLPPVTECPDTASGNFDGTGTLGSGRYAFVDVTLTTSTVITGTRANPTIVCASGTISIPNHAAVNFEYGGNGKRIPREPASLFIFSTPDDTSTPTLDFGNHAAVSAAIYAPSAAFKGGAQGNIYGSIIASSIDNNGGWNVHFDEALRDNPVNTPVYVTGWVEK